MNTGILKLTFSIVTTLCLLAPIAQPVLGGTLHHQTTTGITIYVGGSGPGNYTTIQDAVDHASDGDIVYVYDISAPYHETVLINHAISLIGENTQTTIIDATGLLQDIITVLQVNVTISGFTLAHGASNGVIVYQDDAHISDLKITNCKANGIILSQTGTNPIDNCIIERNTVSNTNTAISSIAGNDTCIKDNILINSQCGISLNSSFNNNISWNTLNLNNHGINDSFCGNNHYYMNIISNCTTGIDFISSSKNSVIKNNFMNNTKPALFARYPTIEIAMKIKAIQHNNTYFLHNFHIIGRISWQGNYWNKSLTLPYAIYGKYSLFPKLQLPVSTRVEFDLHPAKKPYNILSSIATKVDKILPYNKQHHL